MSDKRKFRLWRRVAILVAIPVLLIVLARVLLPGDRVRSLVIEQIETATGAEVTLGDASLRFGPGLGVGLDGGTIRGTGEALRAASGTESKLSTYALDLEGLTVSLAIGPLFKKEIRINSIRVHGPHMNFAWDGGEADIADYKLVLKDLGLGVGAVTGAIRPDPASAAPGEMIPADLEFAFDGGAGRVTAQEADYLDVAFEGMFADRVLTLEKFAASRSTGRLSGDARLDYATDPWGLLTFHAEAEKVPATALLEPWLKDLAERLEGDLDAVVHGGFSVRDSAAVLNTMDLEGALLCGPGQFRASDLLREASPYLGDRQDLKDIRFDELAHGFKVKDGKYLIEGIRTRGADTEWTGLGWLDFQSNLDLDLSVRLPAGFTPDLGQWSFLADGLKDKEGRVNLAFNLNGRTSRPNFKVDLGDLTGRGRQQAQEEAVDKALEEAKKGSGGLLDKWKTR
jgi:hypothetical protein